MSQTVCHFRRLTYRIRTLCGFVLLSAVGANAQEFLDSIAVESCRCMDDLVAANEGKITEVQFGLCILDRAAPYSKELLAQYQIDMATIQGENARQLGELVALRMLKHCPDYLLMISGETQDDHQKHVEGIIKDLITGQFNTLLVADADGRNYSLLWLHDFNGSGELMKDRSLLTGVRVSVEYAEQELFDPRIQEYRKFKVMTALRIQ